MLDFFKNKGIGSSNLKIDLIFQYHSRLSNALVLYNLGSRSIYDITVKVSTVEQNMFHFSLEHISSKIGELIKLDDFKNDEDLPFWGEIDRVIISVHGQSFTFVCNENKFIRV